MDIRKFRGSKGDKKKETNPASQLSTPPLKQQKLNNIRESSIWQQGKAGINNLWANYQAVLKSAWQRMTRSEQEAIIIRLCQIFTIGTCGLMLTVFYSFPPPLIRLVMVPGVIAGSFWLGTKVIAPTAIARFESYLNKEY